jgi:hypothetical protein
MSGNIFTPRLDSLSDEHDNSMQEGLFDPFGLYHVFNLLVEGKPNIENLEECGLKVRCL